MSLRVAKVPGSKWRLADWYVAHLPATRVYLEPYFGSGAVLFNKPRSPTEVVNDIDGRVVALFRCLRDRPEDLARVVSLDDSPYLAESVHGERTDCYRHEMKTEAEHAEKLAALLEHPGPVLSCGYRTKLYDDMLLGAGWSLLEARAYAEHGNPRIEAMYINPIAAAAQRQQLHLGVA